MFKWQRVWVIGIVILLIVIGVGSFWYYQQQAYDPMAHVTHVYHSRDIPASTATWTTYKDSEYPFTVLYPSDWRRNSRDYNGEEDISISYQVETGPDIHALDITCIANPKRLTARQWNEQYPDLSTRGPQTLASGANVFVSTGHGQTDFTLYTAVFDNKVCEIGTEPANSGNNVLINKVVNSFQWEQ